jgi:tetratricopeptide (TPR) repeat protein
MAEAERLFRDLGDERGVAIALLVQGHDEWTSCHAAAAAEKYREALPYAERAGRSGLADEAIANLCTTVAFGPTPVDAATTELAALAERARSVGATSAAYRSLARMEAIRGDFEVARDLFRRGREPLLDAGLILYHASSAMGAAFIEELAGDHEAAYALNREGFAMLTDVGEHAYASTIGTDLARTSMLLGRDDEAATWVAQARELCPPGDVSTMVSADAVDAFLHARSGRLDEAERLAERAVAQADATDFWVLRGEAYQALAFTLAARGRAAEAEAAFETAIGHYEAKGATIPARRARELAEL